MSKEFQCRFCQECFKEVLEFLDHFETHMNQKENKEPKATNDEQNVDSKSENGNVNQKEQPESNFEIEQPKNVILENEIVKKDLHEKRSESDRNSTSNIQKPREIEKGKSGYKCDTCGKSYDCKSYFERHLPNCLKKAKVLAAMKNITF